MKKDVDAYNKYLEKNLSWHKRLGKIKRKDYWNILGNNAIRLDKRLGIERIRKLRTIVEESKEDESISFISRMTANDFFNYCEACYGAND